MDFVENELYTGLAHLFAVNRRFTGTPQISDAAA